MEHAPSISVLLGVHERADRKLLGGSLQSLSAQTLPRDRWEALILTDFDDEGLRTTCHRLGFEYVRSNSRPLGGKVLEGIRSSHGSILTLLDYDDRYAPGRLAAIDEAFQADPKLGLWHDGIECIDEQGRPSTQGLSPVFRMMGFSRMLATVPDPRKSHTSPRLGFSRPDFHGLAFRREVAELCTPYLPRVEQAVDSLVFNVGWIAPYSVRVDPRHLYEYRVHSSNISLRPGERGLPSPSPGRDGYHAQLLRDYAVILEMISRSDRIELLRDFQLRLFSDHLMESLRVQGTRRSAVWRALGPFPSHLHRTNVSPLLLYTAAYALLGMLSPRLAGSLAGN